MKIYSIAVTKFHRIPSDVAAAMIPNGTKITKSDHCYDIYFEMDTDCDNLLRWVAANLNVPDEDVRSIVDLMDQQQSPDSQNTHQEASS